MRKLIFTFGLALTTMAANAQETAHLSGTIKGLDGGDMIVMRYVNDTRLTDTLKVKADGTFSAEINVGQPLVAYIMADKQEVFKKLFLENGMKATINASIVKDKGNKEAPYTLKLDYQGDNSDCYEFENTNDDFEYGNRWTWEWLETHSFRQYRTEYLAYADSLKAECCKMKSMAYKRMKIKEIDDMLFPTLSRYAWRKNYTHDAEFTTWMLSYDHDDPANIELAWRYLRWYKIEHPMAEGETYFTQIKNAFANQDVRNILADEIFAQLMENAPEDMDELFADYKTTSTDPEGLKRSEQIYNHYRKMQKGMPAVDFTFYDAKGKKYSLKDFRGKALYIDVWATWCGPCCVEIPHMAKLVKSFKGDKRINLISISFDENEKKWLDKVAADKPQWGQYRCPDNFASALCREYGINAIPRFLMFDAEGNIISLNAPRPSESDTEEWIRTNLRTGH